MHIADRVAKLLKVRKALIAGLDEATRPTDMSARPVDELVLAQYLQAYYLSEIADAHERINLEG